MVGATVAWREPDGQWRRDRRRGCCDRWPDLVTPGPDGLRVPQAAWPLSGRGWAARLVDVATVRFLEGREPYARQAFFADVHSIDGLAPEGAVLARELVQDNGDVQRLFVGEGWSLHLVLLSRRPEVQVMVTAE